jgi:hypothetical protein
LEKSTFWEGGKIQKKVCISGLIEKKDPFSGKCQKFSEGRICDAVPR